MARGNLQAQVRLPSDGEDHARSGKVTFLDNAVQNGTGTVNLRATIPNSDRHFWPGQFVNVRLVLSTEKGAVLIPNEGTQISQKGPFVYVVKPDQTTELRLVTLGQRQGGNVVVTSGLAAGENVVLTGQLTIVPGLKVKVVQTAPATPNPSGKSAGDGSGGQGGRS
jgi:multidrug efflux system membrane fusion protein